MMNRKFFRFFAVVMAVILVSSHVPALAAAKKTVTVKKYKKLLTALADPKVGKIKISIPSQWVSFTIPETEGTKSKKLEIDAPNAQIENRAVFKSVVLTDTGSFTEEAQNNSITVKDKDAQVTVDEGAAVKKLTLAGEKAYVRIYDATVKSLVCKKAGGNVDIYSDDDSSVKITLSKKTGLTISGYESAKIKIVSKAAGSAVETSVPVDLTASQNASVVLNYGSEGSVINSTSDSVKVSLTNYSYEDPVLKIAGKVQKAAVPTPAPSSAPYISQAPTPGISATPTQRVTATPTPRATATPTPRATATPTPRATATPTPRVTATPTPRPTATPTVTPIPTEGPDRDEPTYVYYPGTSVVKESRWQERDESAYYRYTYDHYYEYYLNGNEKTEKNTTTTYTLSGVVENITENCNEWYESGVLSKTRYSYREPGEYEDSNYTLYSENGNRVQEHSERVYWYYSTQSTESCDTYYGGNGLKTKKIEKNDGDVTTTLYDEQERVISTVTEYSGSGGSGSRESRTYNADGSYTVTYTYDTGDYYKETYDSFGNQLRYERKDYSGIRITENDSSGRTTYEEYTPDPSQSYSYGYKRTYTYEYDGSYTYEETRSTGEKNVMGYSADGSIVLEISYYSDGNISSRREYATVNGISGILTKEESRNDDASNSLSFMFEMARTGAGMRESTTETYYTTDYYGGGSVRNYSVRQYYQAGSETPSSKTVTDYYEDGNTVRSETTYSISSSYGYYYDEKVVSSTSYRNDAAHSVESSFMLNADQSSIATRFYENGNMNVQKVSYDNTDGYMWKYGMMAPMNGYMVWYSEDGTQFERTDYSDGLEVQAE